VTLPGEESSPLRKIGARVLVAVGLIVFVAILTYVGRDGYVDPEDDSISLLDAFYYSTVSITTTGYGDVRPVSDEARLVTTLLVTPARILFLILLVGTTLEVLADRTRTAYRLGRWRKRLRDHTIVCGYGTKGRSAVETLLARGTDPASIVVIDKSGGARLEATACGCAAISGDATETYVLEEAGIADASNVIVAVDRDDAAVLTTLTARELAPRAEIAVAVREDENVHLLKQSGADAVISSSSAAGRLLGVALETPEVAGVLEDLLSIGEGLDIEQHVVGPGDEGPAEGRPGWGPIVAVVRGDDLLHFNEGPAQDLRAGDRVIALRSHGREPARDG
jgi:voltage-gated potassium channel